MLKLNRGDQAKACFMEALALDVKCYEAFEQLVDGEMMTPEEGKTILVTLRISFDHSSRVAVCKKSSLPRANASRCGFRTVDVSVATTQVQTYGGTRRNSAQAGR